MFSRGAKYIADALFTNRALTTLIISSYIIIYIGGNQIYSSGAKRIADALLANKTLTSLYLCIFILLLLL